MKLMSYLSGGILGAVLTPSLVMADVGAVYTLDNATSGNHVLAYERGRDGTLKPSGVFATGGQGTGTGLGNQGALVLSRSARWLFAVNAGSHELSVFAVREDGLELTDKHDSGGLRPVSVTQHGHLVYVLNAGGGAGGEDNISGFIFNDGKLTPLANSTRALSAGNTGPAQIQFGHDGEVLVVTEKATNLIDTFVVDDNGLTGARRGIASAGPTPFGFAFGRNDSLLVSEAAGGAADASSVSSYELSDNGGLRRISPSVPTTETAACWVVVTRDGRFAYVSNTGSGSISAYRVDRGNGRLALRDADGRTGVTGDGSGPIDLALTKNSRFLYSLNSRTGSISGFQVANDGGLEPIPGVAGLPAGANGLVAR
jgi:6-phosphogluconolactonase (cycloisomerase 2 family)